jgi:hypothetical protein
VLSYFIILNGYYFVTSIISFRALRRYSRSLHGRRRRTTWCGSAVRRRSASWCPRTTRAANCLGALRSLLDLDYPSYEIIFVNDGLHR